MTINFQCGSRRCFKSEHLWDYAFLDGCFGESKIKPMDIDGMIERHGHFLFIETKKPDVRKIPTGQMMALERLATSLNSTVLVLFGEPNAPERGFALYPGGFRDDFDVMDAGAVRDFVSRWFIWVNRKVHE